MRFKNANEMYKTIYDNSIDLYSPEHELYLFSCNDVGSIGYNYISDDYAREIAEEVNGNLWTEVITQSNIIDSEDYESWEEGDPTPVEWLEYHNYFEGEWYNTKTYLEEVS